MAKSKSSYYANAFKGTCGGAPIRRTLPLSQNMLSLMRPPHAGFSDDEQRKMTLKYAEFLLARDGITGLGNAREFVHFDIPEGSRKKRPRFVSWSYRGEIIFALQIPHWDFTPTVSFHSAAHRTNQLIESPNHAPQF